LILGTAQLGNAQEKQKSALTRRPNDLRHAHLSTWLNGGVAAT
jgi:hypothetical protein